MNLRRLFLAITGLASLSLYGCASAPGRPAPDAIPVDPDEVSDFAALYGQNCTGCHGPDGKGGAAIAARRSDLPRNCGRFCFATCGCKRSWRNLDAGVCKERRWDAHRQTDRCNCPGNSRALVEARRLARCESAAILLIGSRAIPHVARTFMPPIVLLAMVPVEEAGKGQVQSSMDPISRWLAIKAFERS